MLTSLVLRYLDSMAKMFQALLAVIFTMLLDAQYNGETLSFTAKISVGIILTSVFLYKLGGSAH
jgi:drug/metabolite transporter (DMT)-like permease